MMRVHPTVTYSTMITQFIFGRKVRCHKEVVEKFRDVLSFLPCTGRFKELENGECSVWVPEFRSKRSAMFQEHRIAPKPRLFSLASLSTFPQVRLDLCSRA